jgi:hypothetical protein
MKDESSGRRAAAYWFIDGLPDIVFGMSLMLIATAGIVWRILAPHAIVYDLLLTGGGIGLFYWKGRAVLDVLKSRLTYPRTGYVQPPKEVDRACPPRGENVTYYLSRTGMKIFVAFCISFSPRHPGGWSEPVVMLAPALALYVQNRRSERPYLWWWTLILALTGLLFPLLNVPALLQSMVMYLLAGGWLLALGVWTLIHYLRANPANPASVNRAPEGLRA